MPSLERPDYFADPSERQLPNMGGTIRAYGIPPVPLDGIAAGLLPGGGRSDAGAPEWWISAAGGVPQPGGLFSKPTARQLGAGNVRVGGLSGCVPGMGEDRQGANAFSAAGLGEDRQGANAFSAAGLGGDRYGDPRSAAGLGDAAEDMLAFQQLSASYAADQAAFAALTPLGQSGAASPDESAQQAALAIFAPNPTYNPVSWGGGAGSSFGGTMAEGGTPSPAASVPGETAPAPAQLWVPTHVDAVGRQVDANGQTYSSWLAQHPQSNGTTGQTEDSWFSSFSTKPGAPAAVVPGTTQQPGWNWVASHQDAQGVWVDASGVRADGSLGAASPAPWTADHKDALGRWVSASGYTYFGEPAATAPATVAGRSAGVPGTSPSPAPTPAASTAAQVGQAIGSFIGAGTAVVSQIPGVGTGSPGGARPLAVGQSSKPKAKAPGAGMSTGGKVALGLGALGGAALLYRAFSGPEKVIS